MISQRNSSAVANAFNTAAQDYDKSFNENPVTQRLRQKIYHEIEKRIRPGASVLDLNCGTGTDAIYFGGKGMSVTGIDISEEMIKECKNKLQTAQLSNVVFHISSIENLSSAVANQFDLVLSNFGGLNCIKHLESIGKQISDCTKQHGYFIAVVMPKFSLWETMTGILKGKFGYAFRRFQKTSQATGFQQKSFDVYYYSPRELASYFQSSFEIELITGLNIVSPPPSSSGFFLRHPRISSLLVRLDELIESFPFFRSAGDHYMLVMKRK